MTATATLRDLIEDMGPALPPPVAVAVARGLLARIEEGAWDDAPPPARPEAVEIEMRGAAVVVRPLVRIDQTGVGKLLYEMLAGGPVARPKDRVAGARPRPLAELREFLHGGPSLPRDLVTVVERLLGTHPGGPYESAEAAIDAIDALRLD